MGPQQLFDTGDGDVLKALTVKQPWASLIVAGTKDVENRPWRTKFRGRLLIHAAGRPDRRAELDAGESPLSAIIGSVDVVDCVRDSDSEWANEDSWHWVLANPVQFETPIPSKGKLSLWTPDALTLALLD